MTTMSHLRPHVGSHLRRALLGAALLLPAASVAGAQDFNWSGTVGRDNWVRLRNTNGAVIVEQGTGNKVEITATKRASRGGDPSIVRVEAKQAATGGDVLVCAMWDEAGICEDGEYRGTRKGNWNSDDDRRNVSVEFRVKLPAGVRLDASTVNGEVNISGATSEIRANTVNGAVRATSTGGPVQANTVNGSIDVRMGAVAGTESLRYSTVNGSVRVQLPPNVNADVELSTVNGSLETDFPLTVQGRMDRRNIKARLGTGGARLTFSTVNGSIELVKM
jgi:hypothetical protein